MVFFFVKRGRKQNTTENSEKKKCWVSYDAHVRLKSAFKEERKSFLLASFVEENFVTIDGNLLRFIWIIDLRLKRFETFTEFFNAWILGNSWIIRQCILGILISQWRKKTRAEYWLKFDKNQSWNHFSKFGILQKFKIT